MVQASLFDNPVYPPNPFKPGSQNFRLYNRIKEGAVTNAEIIRTHGIFNSTGRISEIREFLAPHGIRLECQRVKDGLFQYSIKGNA
jgi:hypothetical protein